MSAPLKTPLTHRRSTSIGTIVGRIFATLIVLAVVAGAGGLYTWTASTSDGPLGAAKIVDIPEGLAPSDIADKLATEGVVSNPVLATLGLTAMKYAFNIDPKAGEYEFSARSTLMEVLGRLKSGKRVFYKLSVPEGFTTWQVLERMASNDVLVGDVETVPTEGELLPDTYIFYRGRTRQSLVDQMKLAQENLVAKLWPARASDLPFKTPEEALILASIVEKETGQADERAHVAAVFVNRMRKGMRLQSDPTIIYGITRGQGKLDRPIYRSDIRNKTDYNTYQIDGLPPTPIANPGTASIKAVLNPIETKDVFFVADGTGGHVFAKTLDEHNANVKKWRNWLKDQKEEQAATGDDKLAEATEAEAGRSEEPEANNTDAPLPDVAAGDAQDQTATAEPKPGADEQAADEPASTFKVVEVAGRSVPIPKDKPVRQ